MNRIKILDSFRCIAIVMVLFDHYLSTFTKKATAIIYPYIPQSAYPYGDKYSDYFWYGYLGVQLFFMISGFVIYMSLEKTKNFQTFIARRFLRLFPLLLVCSLITFFIPDLIDAAKKHLIFHRPFFNFFPSLTFTDLWIWNIVFKTKAVEYIDNAYWTLGVEMKYYIYVAALYFVSKASFFKNWLYYSSGVIVSYFILIHLYKGAAPNYIINLKKVFEVILFVKYLIYFTLGSAFYRLFKKMPFAKTETTLLIISSVTCAGFFPAIDFCAMIAFIMLFLAFIYKPDWLFFLNSKVIIFIGLVSYPLYLIHQNVGILLINYLSDHFSVIYPECFIIPVMVLMVLLAYILHKLIEIPGNAVVKKIFK